MCVKLSCRRRCSMNRDFVNWGSNFLCSGSFVNVEMWHIGLVMGNVAWVWERQLERWKVPSSSKSNGNGA